MLTTSWPTGSALGKPRKRRKRPTSKRVREERRAALTTSQVVRKLTQGQKFDLTIPARIDSRKGFVRPEVREQENCRECSGPLRLTVMSTDGGLCTLIPHAGRCGGCVATVEKIPAVRLVGVKRAANLGGAAGTLIGQYRQLQAPSEDNPDMRAGNKYARAVLRGTV